jgi:hypothetical protein
VLPRSCADVATTEGNGELEIDPDGPDGASSFVVRCDEATDGGGWTLVGSLVNEGERNWTTLEMFTEESELGAREDAESADYKGLGWTRVIGDDLLVRTDEYAVAYTDVLGARSFAGFISAHWSDAECSTEFIGGTPPYTENLDDEQTAMFDIVVRPLDTNAMGCYPGGAETSVVGLNFKENWTIGLGNRGSGSDTTVWNGNDMSLLRLSQFGPGQCASPGVYPCNPAGFHQEGDNCYGASCKAAFATIWIR